MAGPQAQNYANHKVFPRAIFLCTLGMMLAALLGVFGLYMLDTSVGQAVLTGAILLNSVAAIYGIITMRYYAVGVQDRIVRLETLIRLQEVLPEDLWERAKDKLTLSQVIAIRFASDEELPGLVEKVLAENIQSRDAIKRLVKQWKPDHYRV